MTSEDLQGKVVILLRTSSVARAPVYAYLRSVGVTLVLVHPFTPMDEFNGIFHYHITHDTNDVDALESVVVDFLHMHKLRADAIVSFDEYGVYPAAALTERFAAKLNSADAAEAALIGSCIRQGVSPVPLPSACIQRVNVKSRFRAFCNEMGINSPGCAMLRNSADDVEVVMREARMEFPVVLKPSPGAGSLFAKLCHTVEDARHHSQIMWTVFESHPDMKHFRLLGTQMHILVEEYIGGQEVDIDCVVERGKVRFCSISDNFEVKPPYFAEQGGLCPSELPAEPQAALRELFDSYVRAEGSVLNGVLHFEAKYDFARQKAYVIEVNLRMGSAETNTMVSTCYNGLQLGESFIRLGLGLPLDAQFEKHFPISVSAAQNELQTIQGTFVEDREAGTFKPSCYCASVNIYPSTEGVLVRTQVPTEDKALVLYSVSQKPGALVAPPPKVFYLLCWMVARGTNPDEAKRNINRLTDNFYQEITAAQ